MKQWYILFTAYENSLATMKKLVILHIGYVDGNKASGVIVAIPKMVHAQHKYADTMLKPFSKICDFFRNIVFG